MRSDININTNPKISALTKIFTMPTSRLAPNVATHVPIHHLGNATNPALSYIQRLPISETIAELVRLHKALIAINNDANSTGVIKPNKGICGNLHSYMQDVHGHDYSHTLSCYVLKVLPTSWVHHSGFLTYPVPPALYMDTPKLPRLAEEHYLFTDTYWDLSTPYGQARLSLLAHLIRTTGELIPELKELEELTITLNEES